MRWFLIMCVLVAVSAETLLNKKQRRNWPYIKNNISKKLFGKNTAVVVQQPEIPRNQSYQLFKIDGYEDVLINLTRSQYIEPSVTVNEENGRHKDPDTGSPDLAIVGDYLGTKTQEETLQAIQAVNSLLKSGILSAETEEMIKKSVMPMKLHINKVQIPEPDIINLENRDSKLNPVGHHPNSTNNNSAQYSSIDIRSIIPKNQPNQTKYSNVKNGDKADVNVKTNLDRDKTDTRTIKAPLSEYNDDRHDVITKPDEQVIDENVVISPHTIEGVDGDWDKEPINYNTILSEPSAPPKDERKVKGNPDIKTQSQTKRHDTSNEHIPKERIFTPPENDNLSAPNKLPNFFLNYFV